ncbi:expressed unknown protein [Seminavis robusta]|uniref:Uncharacterized protein n=1 Tax=Seminavis robusta TaxID=568900 RepID=A0A9N8EZ47_9STRA|nr:expressed unknown protein [Seminavis robusta]|eukprot:Sro2518_g330050.1 n/a (213) ;mRNA; f:1752-2390
MTSRSGLKNSVHVQYHPNVQVLVSLVHLQHISNTLRMAIQQVTTEFVHIMEHDFPFTREIDHQLLVNALRDVPELRIIRFSMRLNGAPQNRVGIAGLAGCAHNLTYDGMYFHLAMWSNNNHFTTRAYYEWLLEEIGPVPHAPKAPIMTHQTKNCTLYGQYMYGPPTEGWHLYHIDGKSESYKRTFRFNNHKRCPKSTADVPSSVLPWVRCPI